MVYRLTVLCLGAEHANEMNRQLLGTPLCLHFIISYTQPWNADQGKKSLLRVDEDEEGDVG